MASHPIYQFYVELEDFEPKMWRRFQVMNHIKLSRLGYIVMVLYDMMASHVFCIDVDKGKNFMRRLNNKDFNKINQNYSHLVNEKISYHLPDVMDGFYDTEFKLENIFGMKLKEVIEYEGDELTLFYDFGDSWEVKIKLEKIIYDDALPGNQLPRVLEGEGKGIIEDIGGVSGLNECVLAFKKRKGEDYESYRTWLGVDDFDITNFDLKDMNFRLKKIPVIYEKIYERQENLTKYALSLLERDYEL